MSWSFYLKDGHGSGNVAKVNGEGELGVVVHPHPPRDEEIVALPFRSYFTLNGDGTTIDMRVNGATTNQQFTIEASDKYDRYIKSISVVIADVNSTLNNFGNIAALANGVEFKWSSLSLGDYILQESIKSNFDFIRLAGHTYFGDGTNAGKYSNLSGNSDGYAPFIDFKLIYGLQYGIRIRKGTTEKLVFTIKDDITTIDAFNVIAYGIDV